MRADINYVYCYLHLLSIRYLQVQMQIVVFRYADVNNNRIPFKSNIYIYHFECVIFKQFMFFYIMNL
jgi:hypothetical protein